MSIRIGVQFGGWPLGPVNGNRFFDFVDKLETLGFDSLWFSDRLVSTAPTLGSISALAAVAARTRKLKFGSAVLVVPTRHPVELAKEIACIDMLSGGRMLPAFGLGTEDEREYEAAGVAKAERAGRTDEAIGLLRRLWIEDHVNHHGRYYHLTDVTINPKPVQSAPGGLPIWFGGRSEPAYRRTGRLGDGWLASSITPAEVTHGIEVIQTSAAAAGRSIDDDHYGAIIGFRIAESRQQAREGIVSGLTRIRNDADIEEYSALGTPDDCIEMIQRYISAGASKFVMRPACSATELDRQIELLAREVVPAIEATRV
jgi:probable F420-dependent oxidoreductase